MLYDLRNYDKEPFDTFRIQDDDYLQRLSYPPRMPEFSKLEFSNDGKSILVGTQGGVHYILDAFRGEMKARLVDHAPNTTSALSSGDVCFSPDGRFVMGGKTPFHLFWGEELTWDLASGDAKIAVWDLHQPTRDRSLSPIHKLDAKSFGPSNVLAINQKSALLTTASTELVLTKQQRELTIGILAARYAMISGIQATKGLIGGMYRL
jgi:COMPASS component SWD2